MNNFLFNITHAEGNAEAAEEAHAGTVAAPEAAAAGHESQGLQIQPTTIAFQALNFIILLVVLNAILYKPLLQLITSREKKIKDGIENAEKAENMLKESNQIRTDMIRDAKSESQGIIEKARKAGEELKNGLVSEGQTEADKIIKSGQVLVESEKSHAGSESSGCKIPLLWLPKTA